MNGKRVVFLHERDETQRLDIFLVGCLPELSRSRIQAIIKEGGVSVNGKTAQKPGMPLDRRSTVEVILPPPRPSELVAEDIPLDIVYENTDLMVVNKPAGMVVHPAAGHFTGTLVHAALAHAPDIEGIGGKERPGIVHRLDKDTSGLILLAKNDRAHRWLQDQFRLRKAIKVYLALLDGKPPTPVGRIEAAIGRSAHNRNLMAVVPSTKGRDSVTEYKVLESFAHHTLVEVHPLTGRTHQIRLHMSFLGSPIVGDTLYGRKTPTIPLGRHFLHAFRLTIRLPQESQPRTFEAPLPHELHTVLDQLRKERS